MIVDTTRFGTMEVDENTLITMPSGPIGFEDYRQFCLIEPHAKANFRWLQSADEPGLAFVVVDPTEFFANYEIEIGDSDVERLRLENEEDALVFTILTIRNGGHDISANLAAPIVINSKNLIGAQVVLQSERYSTQSPLTVGHALAAKAA